MQATVQAQTCRLVVIRVFLHDFKTQVTYTLQVIQWVQWACGMMSEKENKIITDLTRRRTLTPGVVTLSKVSPVSHATNTFQQKSLSSKLRKSSFGHKTLTNLHRSAVDQALQSENGDMDLFLHFLLGLSLESNQTILCGLLTESGSSSTSMEGTVK